MNKLRALILFLILLVPVSALALEGSESAGKKTADAVISNGSAFITAAQVITDGTNAATLVIYDNNKGPSGKIIFEVNVAGIDRYGGRPWYFPVHCYNGIYADIEGIGASYIIEYKH